MFKLLANFDRSSLVDGRAVCRGLRRCGGLLRRVPALPDQGGPRVGADDTEAVAVGLGRTGRIITAAALLFCIAIGAFATSQIVIIKEFGVGAALAVLIDATIVRALLVPSLMKLLGHRNWWSPKLLRWLHERIGLGEHRPRWTSDLDYAPAPEAAVSRSIVTQGTPTQRRRQ